MARLRIYVAVLVLAVAAVIGRWLLEPVLDDRARFIVPLVVVVVAALLGGRGPAILAAVVGGVGTVVAAAAGGGTDVAAEALPAAAFVLGVVAIIALTERIRHARAVAEDQALSLAEAVAARDAALERAEEERTLAERRARIVEASQEIALAVTSPALPPETACRILDLAVDAVGGMTGAIGTLDAARTRLTMAAMRGYPPALVEGFREIPLDADLLLARVARTGQASWFASGEERRAALPPDVADELPDVGGLAAVPIESSGRIYGVMAIGLPAGRRITADERAFVGLVARKIGQALDRARLENDRLAADRAERERAAQLRTVVATIQDGIAVIAGDRIVVRNAALDRLAGGPVETVAGLADALGLAPAAIVDPTEPLEVVAEAAGGEQRWLEMRALPIDPGEVSTEVLVVVRDATPVRTALAMRDAFVGMLSHELRTPVTVILGSAGLLRRRVGGDADTLELVEDIAAESERMNRLIDDLIVLSQPEPVPLEQPEPVLVHHLVGRIVAGAAQRNPQATIDVVAPVGLPPAAGDPTLLEQVVRNLVGNAIKYAGPSPVIRVAAREAEDGVEVCVEDDGPGIAEDEREAVFDIFFRSRSTARRSGGAGIGLFVCRRLLETMGGTIRVERSELGGACFRFLLPRYTAGTDAPHRRG